MRVCVCEWVLICVCNAQWDRRCSVLKEVRDFEMHRRCSVLKEVVSFKCSRLELR